MAFTYRGLETELANKMQTWLAANEIPNIQVFAIPENNKEEKELNAATPENDLIVVKYNESMYGETNSINQVVQDETMEIAFMIIARVPSKAKSVKQLIDLCLLGYMPEFCNTRLVAKEYKLIDWGNNQIFDTYFMKVQRPIFQADDGEVIEGTFKQLFIKQTVQ